jgi:hypothetical protein
MKKWLCPNWMGCPEQLDSPRCYHRTPHKLAIRRSDNRERCLYDTGPCKACIEVEIEEEDMSSMADV